MRRILILTALLLVGFGGGGETAPVSPRPETHRLTDPYTAAPTAFVRSAQLLFVWQVGAQAEPGSGFRASRADHEIASRADPSASIASTQGLRHRAYAARLALVRAGRLSFSTDTPPPSRSV